MAECAKMGIQMRIKDLASKGLWYNFGLRGDDAV